VAVVTWALLPRGVAGVWRRLALVARIGGIRRDRAATYGETAALLAAMLSSPASPAGLRSASLVSDIAASSDRITYARAGPGRDDVAALLRSWRRLARGLPATAARSLWRRRLVP
ncbi:MAG: hypothetical protein ACYDAC_08435, partial [Candidatus Dormibacteria bacterium]